MQIISDYSNSLISNSYDGEAMSGASGKNSYLTPSSNSSPKIISNKKALGHVISKNYHSGLEPVAHHYISDGDDSSLSHSHSDEEAEHSLGSSYDSYYD